MSNGDGSGSDVIIPVIGLLCGAFSFVSWIFCTPCMFMLAALAILFGIIGFLTSGSSRSGKIISMVAILLGGINILLFMMFFIMMILLAFIYFMMIVFGIAVSSTTYEMILLLLL